jgi:cyanobactin cluster PatC/TenC/TruC protein
MNDSVTGQPAEAVPSAPRYRVAAARAAQAAAAAAPDAPPVAISPVYTLEPGLADYGMWVEIFTRLLPPPAKQETFRRGRVWA